MNDDYEISIGPADHTQPDVPEGTMTGYRIYKSDDGGINRRERMTDAEVRSYVQQTKPPVQSRYQWTVGKLRSLLGFKPKPKDPYFTDLNT
jgi:hypothetical protein